MRLRRRALSVRDRSAEAGGTEGAGGPLAASAEEARSGKVDVHEERAQTRPLGLGQVLVFVYGFFAFAAGGRSVYQLVTRVDEAPVAVSLSVTAALVYLVAFTQLRSRRPRAWKVAVAACAFELAGVLVVGSVSLALPDVFPRATVWSTYGLGYGFLPLVLPAAGLVWLLRGETRRAYRAPAVGGARGSGRPA